MAEFVRLEADTDALERLVRETALVDESGPYYDRFLLALDESGLSTPARSGTGSPAVFTSYGPDYFEAYDCDRSGYVVLRAEPTLRWLEWLDDGRVTVTFGGDGELVERAAIVGADHRIEAAPLPTDVATADLDLGMPMVFDEGRYVPDDPAPTVVETTAATLERLVAAADIVAGDGVPVVVEDGEFRLAVAGEVMTGTGRFPAASVEGPDCRNWYGPELGTIARAVEGDLTLQVVPDGSMAVVAESEAAVRRYVLTEQV